MTGAAEWHINADEPGVRLQRRRPRRRRVDLRTRVHGPRTRRRRSVAVRPTTIPSSSVSTSRRLRSTSPCGSRCSTTTTASRRCCRWPRAVASPGSPRSSTICGPRPTPSRATQGACSCRRATTTSPAPSCRPRSPTTTATPTTPTTARSTTPLALDNLGYDASAVGNHEFDFGPNVLGYFMSEFDTPNLRFVSANLDVSGGCGARPVRPGTPGGPRAPWSNGPARPSPVSRWRSSGRPRHGSPRSPRPGPT